MANIDLDQAVEGFWAANQGGSFPVQRQNTFDRNTAYRICLAMIDRRAAFGDAQAGWKMGLTAKAIGKQQGATKSVFAVLCDTGRRPSGVFHPYSDQIRLGWENELRLTISSALLGDNFSEEKPRAAVATVAPALDVIEQRLPPGKEPGFLVGADNGQKRAFVLGEEKKYAPAIHDLSKVSCEVYVDNSTRNEPKGWR